jgi:hypothetical protein
MLPAALILLLRFLLQMADAGGVWPVAFIFTARPRHSITIRRNSQGHINSVSNQNARAPPSGGESPPCTLGKGRPQKSMLSESLFVEPPHFK